VHKIEIAQQAIDISLRRRGAVQPFATIEPLKTALLVVDMQTGFVAPGAVAEIPVAREIVPNINRLADEGRNGWPSSRHRDSIPGGA
jgi:ureidoacrylate peracid hydrolase